MKRSKVEIKKRIAHRMNDRDLKRIYGDPNARPKPIHVGLVSRHEQRTGILNSPRSYGNEKGRLISFESISFQPIQKEKKPISIIVTAYEAQGYIEECLDSIESQTYFIDNNNFEVLLGVDGCVATSNKLLEIRHKYRNLKIFMMENNVGTYITSNTLLSVVKNKNIIRFDSDDVMRPEMINEIMADSTGNKIVRFHFIQFQVVNNKRFEYDIKYYAQGVIFFTEEILNKLGGYMPWKCGADADFLKRAELLYETQFISIPLFYRRLHKNNLIYKYGGHHKLRKEYSGLVGKHSTINIEPIISNYNEI